MGQIWDRINRISRAHLNDAKNPTHFAFFEEDDDAALKREIEAAAKKAGVPPPNAKSGEEDRKSHSAPVAPMTLASATARLGLGEHATPEDIKSAFKKRVLEYHPDKVATMGVELQELAQTKTKEINEAYQFLKKAKGF